MICDETHELFTVLDKLSRNGGVNLHFSNPQGRSTDRAIIILWVLKPSDPV